MYVCWRLAANSQLPQFLAHDAKTEMRSLSVRIFRSHDVWNSDICELALSENLWMDANKLRYLKSKICGTMCKWRVENRDADFTLIYTCEVLSL